MDAMTLAGLYGIAPAKATVWTPFLNEAMDRFAISANKQRTAAFLANVGVESGKLTWLTELWGPTAAQQAYEPPSPKAKELGNTQPGDGFKYRGRGLFQVTGGGNYAICGLALDLDLVNHPELLAQPEYAALSAGWFWDNKQFNGLADLGAFETICVRINGGHNGWPERLALYTAILKVLP